MFGSFLPKKFKVFCRRTFLIPETRGKHVLILTISMQTWQFKAKPARCWDFEESESARGERGRVGQGRVGFRVQARARWEKANYATCLFKKTVFDNENVLWLDLRSQMKP